MKIIERTTFLIGFGGLLMKGFIISGGNQMLMIGATLLAVFYFYFGFAAFNNIHLRAIFKKASYANLGFGRIMGAIGVGALLSIIVTGVEFKLLILTGATDLLVIGTTGLVVILFAAVAVFFAKKKSLDPFYKGIFLRGSIAVMIGFLFFLVPSRSLISVFQRNDHAYRDHFIEAVENPYDKEIQDDFEAFRAKRDSLRNLVHE